MSVRLKVVELLVPNVNCSYRMFETNMDEYLDEEIESLRLALDAICRDWERKVGIHPLVYMPST